MMLMKFRRFVALVAIVALPSLVCTVAAKTQSQRVAHNPGEIYYTCNEVDVHMWSFPLGNTTIHAKVTKAGRVIFDGDVTLTTVQAVAARYGLLRVPVDLSGANQVDTVLNWRTPADGPEPPKPYSDWVDNSACASAPPPPPQIVTVDGASGGAGCSRATGTGRDTDNHSAKSACRHDGAGEDADGGRDEDRAGEKQAAA
jgi:hypothetical protein